MSEQVSQRESTKERRKPANSVTLGDKGARRMPSCLCMASFPICLPPARTVLSRAQSLSAYPVKSGDFANHFHPPAPDPGRGWLSIPQSQAHCSLSQWARTTVRLLPLNHDVGLLCSWWLVSEMVNEDVTLVPTCVLTNVTRGEGF